MTDIRDGLHADIGEILLTEEQIDAKVAELGRASCRERVCSTV